MGTNHPRSKPRSARFPWARWSQEEILDLRLCDLGVAIEGSWLEGPIDRILGELSAKGIRARPHFWLSDEWFSPAGITGVALPFYLAHPRLMQIERSQMLEVEGGSRDECLKLLRHEVGHAVDHSYELHRKRRWQRVFGYSSQDYPEWYRPNPASKKYVVHLDAWYAQAHPDEDFAETFAVWLRPRSQWRKKYTGWAALKKLELVDELMNEVAGKKPKVVTRATPDSLPRLRRTLRSYYENKRERYSIGFTDIYDRDLERLFVANDEAPASPTAASFIRKHRREIREQVARWTGEYQFTLDQVLREIIGRCRELKLRAPGSPRRLKLDFAILLTVHTVHYPYRGGDWHPV